MSDFAYIKDIIVHLNLAPKTGLLTVKPPHVGNPELSSEVSHTFSSRCTLILTLPSCHVTTVFPQCYYNNKGIAKFVQTNITKSTSGGSSINVETKGKFETKCTHLAQP